MDNEKSVNIKNCFACGSAGRYAFTGEDLLMGFPGKFVYAECTACGIVYQTPMPGAEQIKLFYPDEYGPYRSETPKSHSTFKRAVLRANYGYTALESPLPDWLGKLAAEFVYKKTIPYVSNGRLLDIGCGGGNFLLSMQQLGWDVQGVEFNSSAVETCRNNGLRVFHGEIKDAGFPPNTFDVVTAQHVIEHIPCPEDFISEIYRILAPGGRLVLITPNSQALGRKWFGTNWYANDVPRHLLLFAPYNLRSLMTARGFNECYSRTSSTPKIILNSWDYLWKNKGTPSKKKKMLRFVARFYVLASVLMDRGDVIFSMFQKKSGE